MTFLKEIEQNTKKQREVLRNHEMYKNLIRITDIHLFMEHHVFAVWDFMSLLKALQLRLTNVSVPWKPAPNPTLARFINEIVLGEESDVNELGEPKSHFEMYLDAMESIGADTSQVKSFLEILDQGLSVQEASHRCQLSDGVMEFMEFTFSVIYSGKAHLIASAFTYGREDLIPDMFLEILKEADQEGNSYAKLVYYLNRHVEMDGDEHGPLAMKMMEELCGDDTQKWKEATDIAVKALDHRIALWDVINEVILSQNFVCN